MRFIGWAWFVLACLIVGVMFMMSPTNIANVLVALLILGGPGLLLVKLADDLRAHRRASFALVVSLLVPISIVLFLGYGCFVLLRTFGPLH